MRGVRRLLVPLIASAIALSSAGWVFAQEARTGGIAGWVFFETTAQGADGQVWVQAFRMPELEPAGGACVEGFEFEILGLRPGTYKLRFGFGCGVDRDQPPYEWLNQTSGQRCAAEIIVAAGYLTDGMNADVNRERGAEFVCAAGARGTAPPERGIQRPIGSASASPSSVGGDIDFTPGVKTTPEEGTPWGTVVGFAAGLLVAVAGFLLWFAFRGRATRVPVPPA